MNKSKRLKRKRRKRREMVELHKLQSAGWGIGQIALGTRMIGLDLAKRPDRSVEVRIDSVLEHVQQEGRGLRLFKRSKPTDVLTPDLIGLHEGQAILSWMKQAPSEPIPWELRDYQKAKYAELFRRAGFEVEDSKVPIEITIDEAFLNDRTRSTPQGAEPVFQQQEPAQRDDRDDDDTGRRDPGSG